MLRVLALLCCLALLLTPLGPAQAEPGCAMLTGAGAQDMVHLTTKPAHEAPTPAHHSSAQACKQLCAVVAILTSPEPVALQSTVGRPSQPPSARLLDSLPPNPSERPPEQQV